MREALAALHGGSVIAFPTETVYGLGCDPRSKTAVAAVYQLKGRPSGKPLLLVASSFSQVRTVAILRGGSLALAKRHWPGPLTLVLPVRLEAGLVPEVAPKGEVAIRVTSSSVTRTLARRFGFPIVATSANRSGEPECQSAEEVRQVFGEEIGVVVDGGYCRASAPSTLARVQPSGEIEVLRQGAVCLPKWAPVIR
jgi:L-threonylcarbamoyladenylate synthase